MRLNAPEVAVVSKLAMTILIILILKYKLKYVKLASGDYYEKYNFILEAY